MRSAFQSSDPNSFAVGALRLEVERRARIWWVYCYSGGFVGTVLTDLIALVSAVVTETDPEDRCLPRY